MPQFQLTDKLVDVIDITVSMQNKFPQTKSNREQQRCFQIQVPSIDRLMTIQIDSEDFQIFPRLCNTSTGWRPLQLCNQKREDSSGNIDKAPQCK